MLFPSACRQGAYTRIELDLTDDGLPWLPWAGLAADDTGAGSIPEATHGPGIPLLGEHARGLFTRPHLRGHRVDPAKGTAGGAWTTRFGPPDIEAEDDRLALTAADSSAQLGLRAEIEALVGGALRLRHTVTNIGRGLYLLDGLEVVLPVDDRLTEVLDFTGRHEHERAPQRHCLTDGLWLRDSREGRPGLDAATVVVLGTPGFGFGSGQVIGIHVAWSGNSVLRVERSGSTGTTLGGGELLLPGEMVLGPGESYTSPWVFFAAADDGLDGLSAAWHTHQRSLPAHPCTQPVVLNVWEAVVFDHDLDRLTTIADRRPRSAWSGLSSTTGGSTSAAHRACPCSRHGVRAVVRAGDGEP